jgi:hypothetical protein
MTSKKECLALIAQTLNSAPNPESAYVLRARLHRSLLLIGRWVASDLNCELPVFPYDLKRLSAHDTEASRIMMLCNDVLAQSKTLCQPSEALEDRWKNGWNKVAVNLRSLETALREY